MIFERIYFYFLEEEEGCIYMVFMLNKTSIYKKNNFKNCIQENKIYANSLNI